MNALAAPADSVPADSAPAVSGTIVAASELLSLFLAGRSARTLRAYRQDLEDFRRFCRAASVESAAQELLGHGPGAANLLTLSYRSTLLTRGLQPATINRRLAALRSLVKIARLIGQVGWALEIQNLRVTPYRDTRGPGRAAVRRLLQAVAGQRDSKAVRDYAILRLLCDLALRRGEVVALNQGDLQLRDARLWVRGKGRSEKEALALPRPTVQALANWRRLSGGSGEADDPLFTSLDPAGKGSGRLDSSTIYRIVRHWGEAAGVRARPHGLRHTAITEACKAAAQQGIGLDEVIQFSRHRNVQTLMVYRDQDRNVQGQLAALVAGSDDTHSRTEQDP